MKLVPVPTANLSDTWTHWWPWLQACALHNGDTASTYVRQLRDGVRQVHLLWDEEAKACLGILGSEILVHPDTQAKTFHLVWCTGRDRKRWTPLLADLQTYAREHCGCSYFKATARPGWRDTLKAAGFRVRHIVATKEL